MEDTGKTLGLLSRHGHETRKLTLDYLADSGDVAVGIRAELQPLQRTCSEMRALEQIRLGEPPESDEESEDLETYI